MSSPDIRAGVALLIAAMGAKGKSTIRNIEQIDRGYERIEERLNAIGAKIYQGCFLIPYLFFLLLFGSYSSTYSKIEINSIDAISCDGFNNII